MTANQETSLRERLTALLADHESGKLHSDQFVQAARALLAARAEPQAGEWVLVPAIGTEVKADHPQTVLNPDPTFEVVAVEITSTGARARGEKTCWFGVSLLSPAAPSPASRARPEAQGGIPQGMVERLESALKRVEDGRAPRRIPADPSDVDLALSEVLAWLKGEPTPFWVPVEKPADRAPGEVEWAIDFLDSLTTVNSEAAARGLGNVIALIRRLAARAPSAQGEVGYIGVHVAAALRKGRSVATTITPHMAMTDDVAIYTSAPGGEVAEWRDAFIHVSAMRYIDNGIMHDAAYEAAEQDARVTESANRAALAARTGKGAAG